MLNVTNNKTIYEPCQSQLKAEILTLKYHGDNKNADIHSALLNVRYLMTADIYGAWDSRPSAKQLTCTFLIESSGPLLRESPLSPPPRR